MPATITVTITVIRLLTTGHKGVSTVSVRAAECTYGTYPVVIATWRLE